MMKYAICMITLVASLGGASAQTSPDGDNGRYTLSAVKDGVVRLDTRTGTVSTCTDKGNGWACNVVPDERAALDSEIGRLQAENETLKAQLERRKVDPGADPGKTAEALPTQDPLPPKQSGARKIEIPKIEIPLPSDQDIDRALSAVERAWRRLVDMAGRVQRDYGGRI